MKSYTQKLFESLLPVRSRGAQLLRDVALGHPEYGPEIGDPPPKSYTSPNDHTSDANCYVSPTAGPATWTNTTSADPAFTTVGTGV